MKSLSRRRFCVSALLTALGVPGRELSAQVPFAPLSVATDDLPVEMLYGIGTRMLKEGRTFEKAAAHFARGLEKDPNNADYALALGCAYASRAASLAWAGAFAERLAGQTVAYKEVAKEFSQEVAQFRQRIEDKKASAAEIKDFEAGLEAYKQNLKPPPEIVIRSKDDKAPYELTRPALMARLTKLQEKALAAWAKGVELSKTPADKAQAQYVRGWGMALLQFYLTDDSSWRARLKSEAQRPSQFRYYRDKTVPLELKDLPTAAQIKAALDEATKLAPENALYWQALADFSVMREQTNSEAATTALYRRAATLAPKNANLWVRIYDRETAYQYGEKQTDALLALDDLRRAQARDKSNAWYGYEEASRELIDGTWDRSTNPAKGAIEQRPADRSEASYAVGKRAINAMARANTLPRFAPPRYKESVPVLLARAWRYAPTYWHDGTVSGGDATATSVTRFQNMAWAARQYAQSLQTDQKNEAGSLRVLRILLQAGMRVMGDPLPETDLLSEENYARSLWAIAGSTLGSSAYNGLLKIVTSERDPDAHEALTRESAAWEKRYQDWSARIPQDETALLFQIYDRP